MAAKNRLIGTCVMQRTAQDRDDAVVDSAFRLVCLLLDKQGIAIVEQAAQRAVSSDVLPSGLMVRDEVRATAGRLAKIAQAYYAADYHRP